MSRVSVELCYCCSQKPFSECCEPKLSGAVLPATAEELMRSRYSAYVTVNVPYIIETTSPKYRKYYNPKSIAEWASGSTWISLEILAVSEKRVKFVATYFDENRELTRHTEDSRFEKIGERWYFAEGE